MTATMPDRKEPKARERTENHTGEKSASAIFSQKPQLTSQICEVNSFRKHCLSNPQDGKKIPSCKEQFSRGFDFEPRIIQDSKIDFLAVLPLDLVGLVEKEANKRANTLKRDEDEVDRVRDTAGLIAVRVESQIDSTTKDLTS